MSERGERGERRTGSHPAAPSGRRSASTAPERAPGTAAERGRRRAPADPAAAGPERRPRSPALLSIGALSRAARIPVETLRTWERRYGAPMPVRKPSGHRLYPATLVGRLERVQRLLARGHRPADVLPLTERELDRLLALAEPAAPAAPSLDPHVGERLERSLDEAIRAARELDRPALMRELMANWIRLGPLRFLEDYAGRLLVEIGRAWEQGILEVRHEHFASSCLSDFLREVRDPFEQQARGPKVAAALLPGDRHDGGLRLACTFLATRGYRVVWLGADTPIDQIAAAAAGTDIEVVAVSVSASQPRRRSAADLERLRALLPAHVRLWVGGDGAPPAIRGGERFESLAALAARVA